MLILLVALFLLRAFGFPALRVATAALDNHSASVVSSNFSNYFSYSSFIRFASCGLPLLTS